MIHSDADSYSAGDQAFEPRQALDPGDRIWMNGGLEYTGHYTMSVSADFENRSGIAREIGGGAFRHLQEGVSEAVSDQKEWHGKGMVTRLSGANGGRGQDGKHTRRLSCALR